MKIPPAFQFFPRDWLTSRSVSVMTPAQRGYYINLLSHAWLAEKPGTLPNDHEILWKLAGAISRREFEKESDLVLAQFRVNKGGKTLSNSRLIQERQAQIRRKSNFVESGRLGASARWHNGLSGDAIKSPLANYGSAFASASATAKDQSQKPRGTPSRVASPRSEREQRRIVEARETRLEKEAEARREAYVGSGPIAYGGVRPEILDRVREIAKAKKL